MQGFGIEIRAVGPRQRAERPIEPDGVEQRDVLEGAKNLAFQNRSKVDASLTTIIEAKRQGIRSDDLEILDAMYRVGHALVLPSVQRFNLERRLARLQKVPVSLEFLAMDLSPGFDQALLCSHESEEIGSRMLARGGRRTGLRPEDL